MDKDALSTIVRAWKQELAGYLGDSSTHFRLMVLVTGNVLSCSAAQLATIDEQHYFDLTMFHFRRPKNNMCYLFHIQPHLSTIPSLS